MSTVIDSTLRQMRAKIDRVESELRTASNEHERLCGQLREIVERHTRAGSRFNSLIDVVKRGDNSEANLAELRALMDSTLLEEKNYENLKPTHDEAARRFTAKSRELEQCIQDHNTHVEYLAKVEEERQKERRENNRGKSVYGRNSGSGAYGRSSYSYESGTYGGYPSLTRTRGDGTIDTFYGMGDLGLDNPEKGHIVIKDGRVVYHRKPGEKHG